MSVAEKTYAEERMLEKFARQRETLVDGGRYYLMLKICVASFSYLPQPGERGKKIHILKDGASVTY